MKGMKPTIGSNPKAHPQEPLATLGLRSWMECPLECQLRSIRGVISSANQGPHLCCSGSALFSISGIYTPGTVCGTDPITFHFLYLTYLMLSFQINEIPV